MSKKMIELPCDRCIHSKVCSRKGAYSNDGECEYFDERKPQGEWKLHGMIYYCSVCGHDCEQGGNNFCGNCGAKMKGGAEQ